MRTVRAYAPAHITGFFEICDSAKNPLEMGSRGAGVCLSLGVETSVFLEESTKKKVEVEVNGKKTSSFRVTEAVVNSLLDLASRDHNYSVLVRHKIDVPISAGYGTSGAGALSTALALTKALKLPLTFTEISAIAHRSEIEHKTGLGDVISQSFGGIVIRIRPGAPGIGVVDKIPTDPNLCVLSIALRQIETKKLLADNWLRRKINEMGRIALRRLLEEPTVEKFLEVSEWFSGKVWCVDKNVLDIIKFLKKKVGLKYVIAKKGLIFSVVNKSEKKLLIERISTLIPREKIFTGDINESGCKLL